MSHELEEKNQEKKQEITNYRGRVIIDVPDDLYTTVKDRPEFEALLKDKSVTFKSNPINKETGKVDLNAVYSERAKSIARSMARIIDSQPDSTLPKSVKKRYKAFVHAHLNNTLAEINNLDPDNSKTKDYIKHLKYFTSVMGVSLKLCHIVDSKKEAGHLLDLGESYANIARGRPDTATIIKLDDLTIVQYEESIPALSEQQGREYLQIVQYIHGERDQSGVEWYEIMSANEKLLLVNLLKNVSLDDDPIKQIRELVSFIPSKLRTINGCANKSRNHLLVYNKEGKLIKNLEELRASFVSPRDIKQDDIRAKITYDNILNIIKEELKNTVKNNAEKLELTPEAYLDRLIKSENGVLPVLLQTLVTPVELLKMITPDSAIHKDKVEQIKIISEKLKSGKLKLEVFGRDVSQKIKIISSNYPQNMKIADAIKGEEIESVVNKNLEAKLIDENLNQIIGTLLSNYNDSDVTMRSKVPRILTAATEMNIAKLIGAVPFSSCVSSKDRKTLVILHSISLSVFEAAYGGVSLAKLHHHIKNKNYKNEHVKNFSKIFTDLLFSGAGQTLAATNAPGSFGVKTISKYLKESPYLMKEIKERMKKGKFNFFDEHEALADKNEIGKLLGHYGELETDQTLIDDIEENVYERPESAELDQGVAKEAIALIHQVLSHPTWIGKAKFKVVPDMPDSAKKMLDLLNETNSEPDLNKIISIAREAGRSGKNRDPLAARLYSAISTLDTELFNPALKSLRSMRDELYHFNDLDPEQQNKVVMIAQLASNRNIWRKPDHQPKGVKQIVTSLKQSENEPPNFDKIQEIAENRGNRPRDHTTQRFYNALTNNDSDSLTKLHQEFYSKIDYHQYGSTEQERFRNIPKFEVEEPPLTGVKTIRIK